MENNNSLSEIKVQRLFRAAFGLAIFTIIYNIAEGLISTYFGYEDESLTLFGFGVDSFIEVISGIGIAHMVFRIQRNLNACRDEFERTALKITGTAFYLLVIGLAIMGVYNLWSGHKPTTTFWGVIISVISIIVMLFLVKSKTRIGRKLNSDAMLADVECTKVCISMSVVLLLSSAIYELTGFGLIDVIGSFGLAYLSFREGRECFEKAEGKNHCSCKH